MADATPPLTHGLRTSAVAFVLGPYRVGLSRPERRDAARPQHTIGRSEGLSGFIPDLRAGGPCDFVEFDDGGIVAGTCGYRWATMDPPNAFRSASGTYRWEAGSDRWVQVGPVPGPVLALARDDAGRLLAGTPTIVVRVEAAAWAAAGWNLGEVAALVPGVPGGVLVTGPQAAPSALHPTGTWAEVPVSLCSWACVTGTAGRSSTGALFVAVAGSYLGGAGPDAGVYRSDDGGSAWTQVLEDRTNLFAFAAAPDGLLLAGARHHPLAHGPTRGAFRSTDDGLTWAPAGTGLASQDVHSLLASGGGVAFAGTRAGVFRSTDGGQTWTADGLAADTVHALAVSATGVLAGTGRGLFRRTEAGWQPFGTGLDGRAVLSLLVDQDAGGEAITVGTDRGVYANRTLVTVAAEGPAGGGAELALGAPRPSPVSGTATVSLSLPAVADVRLVLLDVLGREVAVLDEGIRPAGVHDVAWSAAGLPAGLYLLRLTAGAHRVSRAVTIAR